jgi:FKBP-type peptidyl-prolyl cis-trans isomerase
MRLRIKASLIIAASMMAVVAGCQEPREITPVAPPGFEITRTLPPQGEGAQALGEQGASAPKAKQNKVQSSAPGAALAPPTPIGQPTKTASGLVYETLKEGTGATAQPGQTVIMHYTGTLADGTVFDSSRKSNKPFPVENIGAGGVIPGWNQGIPGMKVGERRKLTIPPELAYGPQGMGSAIPPNATLTFDVELMDVK